MHCPQNPLKLVPAKNSDLKVTGENGIVLIHTCTFVYLRCSFLSVTEAARLQACSTI